MRRHKRNLINTIKQRSVTAISGTIYRTFPQRWRDGDTVHSCETSKRLPTIVWTNHYNCKMLWDSWINVFNHELHTIYLSNSMQQRHSWEPNSRLVGSRFHVLQNLDVPQQLATCSSLQPHESSPYPPTRPSIVVPFTHRSPKLSLPFRFSTTFCVHLSPLLRVLPTQSILPSIIWSL
jgi:hypothetical protein